MPNQAARRSPTLIMLALTCLLLLGLAAPATAEMLYTNWNNGECHRTDTTTFFLCQRAELRKIAVLAKWRPWQKEMPYTIYQGRTRVMRGKLRRDVCRDARQCLGVDDLRLPLMPGHYRLVVDAKRLCANAASGNHGLIRVRGEREAAPPRPDRRPAERGSVLFSNPEAVCKKLTQAGFHLKAPSRVRRVTAWLAWPEKATWVHYTILRGNEVVHRGALARLSSPGDLVPGAAGVEDGLRLDLPRGQYRLSLRGGSFCGGPRSGGQGFVRVWGDPK